MVGRLGWWSLTLLTGVACAGSLRAAPANVPIVLAAADLTALSLEDLSKLEVISVSKAPEKYLQAPAAVFVITAEAIRRSGATSIAEALRLAPGVQVARINSNLWSVGVRGFGGDRLSRSVLVLMDGRAVYSPLFAGTYWEVQDYPLDDIDRIEVIRGPGGTLWGANAFNGVINIITKPAAETQGGLMTAGGGTEERAFGGFRYGGKAGQTGHWRAYGKYFDRDASFHANNDDYDAWSMGQGGFRSDWKPGSNDSITVQGDLYKGSAGGELPIATYDAPFLEAIRKDAELFGANLLGRWSRTLSETSGLMLQWYYDRTNREDLNFREFRDTADLEFQHRFGWLAGQTLTWGFDYRFTSNYIDSVPTIVFDPKNRRDHLGSGFIQNQVPLVPEKLELTFGTKIEHNDFSGWEYQPSARLAWTPTPTQLIWTAGSRAVRTPSQVEQDLQATLPVTPGVPAFARLVGNKNFGSERLTAYEAGYRVQPTEACLADLSAFYNRYDNLLSGELSTPSFFVEPNPAPPHLVLPVTLDNKLEGESHGLEVSGTLQALPGWRWNGTYSLLLMHLRPSAGGSDVIDRAAETSGRSPRHQALLGSSVDLPGHWEWDPTLRYTDVLSFLGVPAYWSFDTKLAWHPQKHVELALVGQNLLQSHHPEVTPGLEIQRGFYGKMTWGW